MELDAIRLDKNMEGIEAEAAEQLRSPCSFNIGDIFGDPGVLPRVGYQYQAEIPHLILEYDCLQLTKKPDDIKAMVDVPSPFLLGLSIPLMWAHDGVKNVKQDALEIFGNQVAAVNMKWSLEFKNSEENQITSNNEDARLKVGHLDNVLYSEKGLSSPKPTVGGEKMDVDLVLRQENKTKLCLGERGCWPLPGSSGEPWGDIEHDSFLLGLYIFGKNLLLVKRFVASKEMGDVLSFYYGNFYRSLGHRRWSDCRKVRNRRCIHGHRIFTGWRQQELLSRLSSDVSKECQDMLLQVSRAFGEGKLSLEEYVFTLRNAVGIDTLVEAVGIGKGKQDLTGISTEPMKTNHAFSVRPEIPIGKACSSLTSGDIVKFLTGGFRLSKARSSDLFWEAVWPRLLARGWHSEQPKDHGLSVSKHSLVFLIPGVKKFSRRRLVKGNHYFDSVSDVLNKVASDPGLLELEIEGAKGSEHDEEYSWGPQINQQRHCYLQPRISNCSRDLMKFTIVDTSLVYEEQLSKVRELRSIPVGTPNVSVTSNPELEKGTSEESEDLAEETNNSNPTEDEIDQGVCASSPECATSVLPAAPDSSIVALEKHEAPSTHASNYKHSRRTVKYQFSRKGKSSHSKYLAPVLKLGQITAVGHGKSSYCIENISADIKLNGEESHCRSNSPDASEKVDFHVGLSQNLSLASSFARDGPDESIGVIVNANCLGTEVPTEQHQSQTLIDLNFPHVPPDFRTDEPFFMETVHSHDNGSADKSSSASEMNQQPQLSKLSDGEASTELQPVINRRRQSTRNRPLTTKALEALACGFLSMDRKRKSVESQLPNNSMSRSSRHVRGRTGGGTTLNNGVSNDIGDSSSKEEGNDGICSGNSKMGGKFRV